MGKLLLCEKAFGDLLGEIPKKGDSFFMNSSPINA